MGRISYLGVHKGDILLIWGYTEGYNFDFGVRQFKRLRNPVLGRSLKKLSNEIFRYTQRLKKTMTSSSWTLKEDKRLVELVEKCRINNYIPWTKVRSIKLIVVCVP